MEEGVGQRGTIRMFKDGYSSPGSIGFSEQVGLSLRAI